MFYFQCVVILAWVCHICAFLLKLLNMNIINGQVRVAAKNINTLSFAYELWVKRAGTFGVVVYCNQ